MRHETVTNFPKRISVFSFSATFQVFLCQDICKLKMEFQDIGVREVLTRAWTAFAASGNPGLDWTPVSCKYMTRCQI